MMPKCECPRWAVDHQPNRCRRPAYVQVNRCGKRLSLCDWCDSTSDVIVRYIDDKDTTKEGTPQVEKAGLEEEPPC